MLFLAGCEEKFPVYHSFCDQNSTFRPSCLHYSLVAAGDRKKLEERLGLPHAADCPFHLKFTRYRVKECNNPVVKSIGSDFDGYIRIEILKGFKCYYKVQSDFKRDPEAAFERVLKQVGTDLKTKK